MKKDEHEVRTHGGRRKDAGRKPTGKVAKKALGVKVCAEAKKRVVDLHEESGHSQASIVEYAISRLKKLPTKLKIEFPESD